MHQKEYIVLQSNPHEVIDVKDLKGWTFGPINDEVLGGPGMGPGNPG